MDNYFRYTAVKDLIKSKTNELIKIVKQNIERCEKKISIHATTIDENSNMETYRLYGELITANIHMLKKGMKSCRLLNYYEHEETYVDIELDESLTPQENAQKYFKKYSKAKSAMAFAAEQMKIAKRELEYLENVLFNLEEANSVEEVEEIREELSNQGYIRKTAKPKRNVQKSGPLCFKSSEGYQIWVGRNNVQNDELTLKFAKPDDLWLHAKNIPGSHVIVRVPDPIPEKTLFEAASLAAWFSKARNSSKVQIDYTRAKYVRKPSGAKPGMVVYVNYKTVVVDPKEPAFLSAENNQFIGQ
nr:NFACT family protein [Thermoclostridium stercorarium]